MKQSLHNVIGSTYSSSSLDSETMKKLIVLIPTKYMDISADAFSTVQRIVTIVPILHSTIFLKI